MFAKIGEDCRIHKDAIVGLKYKDDCSEAVIGDEAVIRRGAIIYAEVDIGDMLATGHNTLIRERTRIGNQVTVGTNVVIDGSTEVGSFVKLETNAYIPTHTKIGDCVFVGPGSTLTNDRYPLRSRDDYTPKGPILMDNVTIGANATILPGITIGKGAFIGAGSIITKDVPPWRMAIGAPAEIKELPEKLKEQNKAKTWNLSTEKF